MRRLLPLFLIGLTLPAQTPPLDKPPQDIDDALRARIAQFYDYHLAQKYRLCEQLIAKESKDDFYVMNKPRLDTYRIDRIEYSEHFTKAKAIIIGKTPVLFPGVGAKIMDQPFVSFWKSENGVWLWYYNKAAGRDTPSGQVKPTGPGEVGSVGMPPEAAMAALQSALKIDKTHLDLVGSQPQTVKLTNTLPGSASLTISCPLGPLADNGITATFDKKDLKANETATLTLAADPTKRTGPLPLQIMVSPTNQVLNLTLTISR